MKKFLSLLLSIGLVIGMVPMNVMAQNGPCQDEYPPAYIEFFDGENGTYIYSTFSQDQIGKIKGVSYDKASNTLTLDNVKRDEKLITNVMGDVTVNRNLDFPAPGEHCEPDPDCDRRDPLRTWNPGSGACDRNEAQRL